LIGVATNIELLPTDFYFEVFKRFLKILDVETAILFVLLIPRFGVLADTPQFFSLLLVQRI